MQNSSRSLLACFAIASTMVLNAAPAKSDGYENACTIMQQRAGWHRAVRTASDKWQVPVSAILAIVRHESHFKANAAARHSTAFGFAQALDGTWNWYRRATKAGAADRSSFADSVDFIGWYMTETHRRTGLPVIDIASHYLAYHEGHKGYLSTRWAQNHKLIETAHKVATIASTYDEQLNRCAPTITAATAPASSPLPAGKPFALSGVTGTLPRAKTGTSMAAEAVIGRAEAKGG